MSVPVFSSIPLVRHLAITSAVVSASVIGYTAVAIQPTNKRLKTLDAQEALTEAESKEADGLIAKWDGLHKVRFLLYGGAWATGLGALLVALA